MTKKRKEDVEAAIPEDSLKAALWYTVAKICEEEEIELGVSVNEAFVANLTEMNRRQVWRQTQTLGKDLEAFSQHANRSQITVEDLFLATRRNPSLTKLIYEKAKEDGDLPPGKAKRKMVPQDSDEVVQPKPRLKPKAAQASKPKASTSRAPAKTIESYAGFSKPRMDVNDSD